MSCRPPSHRRKWTIKQNGHSAWSLWKPSLNKATRTTDPPLLPVPLKSARLSEGTTVFGFWRRCYRRIKGNDTCIRSKLYKSSAFDVKDDNGETGRVHNIECEGWMLYNLESKAHDGKNLLCGIVWNIKGTVYPKIKNTDFSLLPVVYQSR